MGRLPDGELSQSSRAIKWRANKTVKNAQIALEKQGATELIIGGDVVMPKKTLIPHQPEPDAIGVFSGENSQAGQTGFATESDPQQYHCNNCRATVHQGDEACSVCEQRLNWAGL